MKLKYAIWLRNVLILLVSLLIIDFVVKKYYDHVPTELSPFRFIIGISTCLLLQYYIQREQQDNASP